MRRKKIFLSKENCNLIKSIVNPIKKVDYSKCTKGTIHGDIQRSNVLKNRKGEIRIIDFSVMEYSAIAIELATYLSLFCINPQKTSAGRTILLCKEIIREYLKYKKLTSYDLKILPDLMLGTYAANCLAASYELRGKGNDTPETHYWINLGSSGIHLMRNIVEKLRVVLKK